MRPKKSALGDSDGDPVKNFESVMKHAQAIIHAINPDSQPDERYIRELLRFGKAKLHCISSYIGGVAATEACKLIMD